MFHMAGGSISSIIGGIAPNWGPFGNLGVKARMIVEAIMAASIMVCFGIAAWGAARQRCGTTSGMANMTSAETGKGLLVSGLAGVFILGSLGTLFTIVYGMAV